MNIHKTAIIEKNVIIGRGTEVGAYTTIMGNVIIGENCRIASHVSIGGVAEHYTNRYEFQSKNNNKHIVIGNNVVIKEFTTVNSPTIDKTEISDDCYITSHSHISHDNFLGKGVWIAHSCLGGHTVIMEHANIGLDSVTHQFTTIGAYAMIGANSTIVKDIPPFCKYITNKPTGTNAPFSVKRHNLPYIGSLEFDELLHKLTKQWDAVRAKEKERLNRNVIELPNHFINLYGAI